MKANATITLVVLANLFLHCTLPRENEQVSRTCSRGDDVRVAVRLVDRLLLGRSLQVVGVG